MSDPVALDSQAQAILDATAAAGLPPVYNESISVARQRMHDGFTQGGPGDIARRTDVVATGEDFSVGLRLYHPAPGQHLPIVLFFHGGGWIVNDLDTHDVYCCTLANQAQCVVASVDFSRSPEARYPVALEQGWSVLNWLIANAKQFEGRSDRVAVAGDSSGGALAAAIALRTQQNGPELAGQILIYPVTDYPNDDSQSYRERGQGYSLNRDFMDWAYRNYLPDDWSRRDGQLFPLQASRVDALPPTLIVTAEFDPLRDEGREYARKIADAGVNVTTIHAATQMHGFILQQAKIDRAKELVSEISEWTRKCLGERPGE